MNVVGVSGKPQIIPTYYVNIYLPGPVIFSNQLVGAHTLSMDYDVLIGMDIISQSDFSLGYNAQNKGTVFSVTFPSNGIFQLLGKNK